MQISKNIQLNYQIKVKNLYKSGKYIYRQELQLTYFSALYNFIYLFVTPYDPLAKK